jgi:hypothetical protein
MGSWAFDITRAVEKLYREIAVRENTTHLKGLAANRPDAIGGKRWWFDTDDPADPHLYYDEESAWWEVGIVPSFATGFVALQATTPGTQQTGNWNVSGSGILGGNLTTNAAIIIDTPANVDAYILFAGDENWVAGYDDSLNSFSISNGVIPGSSQYLRIDTNGNFMPGAGALGTSATDGFLYVPSTAGVPAGTPTTYAGWLPVTVDDTNFRFYFYAGGAWRSASGAAVPAAAGIVYTDGATLLTDIGFSYDAVNNRVLISDTATAPVTDLHIRKAAAGSNVTAYIQNSSNSANSYARLSIQTEVASGDSDPFIEWIIGGASWWTMGIDNSASDNLVLTRGTAASVTSNQLLSFTNSNAFSEFSFVQTGHRTTLRYPASGASGIGAPSAGAISAGMKIELYPDYGGSNVGFGIGIASGLFWFSLGGTTGSDYGWYGGTTRIMQLLAEGDLRLGAGTSDPGYDFDVIDSKAGDQVIAVRNTRNSSGTDDAYFYAEVGGTSAGDPGMIMRIGTGGNGFYAAIDNSDGDDYKIGTGVTVGSNVCLIIKQATGAVALPFQYRATVTNTADFTALNGAFLVMTWNTETEDVGALHSTSSNTSRFTIPSDGAGNYAISGWACGDSNTTGIRLLAIVKNGVTYLRTDGRAANAAALGAGNEALDNALTIDWIGPLAASDYVELWYYQNSGGSRTLDKDFCGFAIHKLS